MHPKMTLQQLRDLMAVVEHGGFRAAARALHVSQGGLTKSLARFEKEHGVSLIERHAKGVILTPQGEEFVRYARSVLFEANRTEEWLRRGREPRAPCVRLGVSIEPTLKFVPAVLADFRRVQPDVTLKLKQSVATELVAGVRDNRLEFAVTRIPLHFDASDMHVDVLIETESVVVGRSNHPLASATELSELVNCDWVILGEQDLPGAHDETIWELFQEQSLGAPRIAAVTDSLFGVLSMLIESDCLARLPRSVVRHPLAQGLLTALPLKRPVRRYSIALVHKASQQLTPEARTLAAMLASFARLTRST